MLILLTSQVSLGTRTPPRAGQRRAEKPNSSTTCVLHVKALEYISTSLQFTLVLLCLEAKAEAVHTTNAHSPAPRETSRNPCCLPTPAHGVALAIKGDTEHPFQIFLISVIPGTHQGILQGPGPRFNFGIAFQPIISRICPLRFQDLSPALK